MRTLSLAIGVTFSCVLLGCPSRAQDEKAQLESIIEATAKHPQQLRSARVEGVEKVSRTPDFDRFHQVKPGGTFQSPIRAFTWAFKDKKRFSTYVNPGLPKGPNDRYKLDSTTHIETYNGKRQHHIIKSKYLGHKEEHHQGSTQLKAASRYSLLAFGHQLNDLWIADVLRDGAYKSVGTSTDPKWGKLLAFSEQKQMPFSQTVWTRLWFAPGSHFLVVRWEREIKAIDQGKAFHSVTRCDLEKVEKRGGVLFPVQGAMKVYGDVDGQQKLLLSRTLIANSFELNNVSDALFEADLRPGTGITDSDTQEYFHIGPNGERILVDLNGQPGASKKPMAWLFMVGLTTLMVLTTGVLWKKQRRNAVS